LYGLRLEIASMETMQFIFDGFVKRIRILDSVNACKIYHRKDYFRGNIFELPFYPPLLKYSLSFIPPFFTSLVI
jgi:hypothetical protein